MFMKNMKKFTTKLSKQIGIIKLLKTGRLPARLENRERSVNLATVEKSGGVSKRGRESGDLEMKAVSQTIYGQVYNPIETLQKYLAHVVYLLVYVMFTLTQVPH